MDKTDLIEDLTSDILEALTRHKNGALTISETRQLAMCLMYKSFQFLRKKDLEVDQSIKDFRNDVKNIFDKQ